MITLNKTVIICLPVVLLASLFGFSLRAEPQETVDKIAAVVNNRVITFSQLQGEAVKRSRALEPQAKGKRPLSADKEFLKDTLDDLISEMLIEEEIKTRGIEVTEHEINMFIKNLMDQNRIPTMADFTSALALQGLTLEEYRENLKKQAQRTKIMNFVLRSKVNLSDQDLKNYYMQNAEESRAPDSLHLKNIFVAASDKDRAKKKAKINEAVGKLKGGESFESVAKKYSEDLNAKSGGELGLLTSKDLNPAIYDAVKGLSAGRYSAIIENPKGFYVFKLVERKRGDLLNFEDVKENLRSKLTNIEMERHFNVWLAELKSRSYIDIKISI